MSKLLHPALYEYMSSITGLTDILGTGDDFRFYPFGNVQKSVDMPYLTYFIADNEHVHCQGGGAGLTNPRVQLDAWANSKLEAAEIIDICRLALDSFRGTWGTGDNEITVRLSFIDSDREDFTPPTDGSEIGYYRAQADFMVFFVEEV